MSTHRFNATVDTGRRITLRDLPFEEGEEVEVVIHQSEKVSTASGTAGTLQASPLVGLWADRTEGQSSPEYARSLREDAQRRK